jgi:hypothetical protein
MTEIKSVLQPAKINLALAFPLNPYSQQSTKHLHKKPMTF